MSMRETAEADLAGILEDTAGGFGWPLTVIAPSGVRSRGLIGFGGNVAESIDPDTGQIVGGNLVHVSVRISSLKAQRLDVPRGVSDSGKKPWLVTFDDIAGNGYTFKVQRSLPDTTLGVVSLILEAYNGALHGFA